MRAPRWIAVSQSAFEWEREALDFLRDHLPDNEPWRAWSNFEFIDDEGRVNEVDALVPEPELLGPEEGPDVPEVAVWLSASRFEKETR